MRLVLLLALLLASSVVATPGASAQDRVLNVYNWSDYIDPRVVERFTAETGIRVRYDVYDSSETLEGKLLAGRSGYDVIVPTNEPTFSRLIAAGALLPLDRARIPNLRQLDPALMQRVEVSDPGNRHGAIYLWGTIGLGMIPERVQALAPGAPADSWDLLFKPEWVSRLAPCGVTMMDSAIDVIPSILRYLGRDPGSTAPKDLADVERTLLAIRPHIRNFATGGSVEALAAGSACLVMTYSGDVLQAAARAREAGGREVRYVMPKEFAQLWFDMLAIPKDAPHPAEAHRFIDFMLQPDVMAAVTNQVRYPNALPASRDLVNPAVRDDPNVFPPEAALARLYTVRAPTPAADRARTRLWTRFKAGS